MTSAYKKWCCCLVLFIILIAGCEESQEDNWKVSPSFTVENMTLHGTEGKFGIIKMNGTDDEPEFPVGEGRLYHLYFLDDSADVNGKKYTMMAIHQDTDRRNESTL